MALYPCKSSPLSVGMRTKVVFLVVVLLASTMGAPALNVLNSSVHVRETSVGNMP